MSNHGSILDRHMTREELDALTRQAREASEARARRFVHKYSTSGVAACGISTDDVSWSPYWSDVTCAKCRRSR